MLTLTIDNQSIQVAPGTTILTAAQSLGIAIPTLCFLSEFKPATSCLVCLVAIQGQTTLVPACGALVEEGMVVLTTTPEVITARKNSLALLLSEHAGDCLAPCQLACPQNINIPLLLRHIQTRNFNQALTTLALTTAPTNTTLCATCKKPCETVCRRRRHDESVAIALLVHSAQNHAIVIPPYILNNHTPKGKPRSHSMLRHISAEELLIFIKPASPKPSRLPLNTEQGFTAEEAQQESLRCLHCDCRKQAQCRLRDQTAALQAEQTVFPGERLPYTQQVYQNYIYEPGKCIKCGICTQLCERAQVPSGFTFFKRGFATRISVPFDQFENPELLAVIDICIAKCPTGALCRREQ